MYRFQGFCLTRLIRVLAIVVFGVLNIGSVQADPITVGGSATLVPGGSAGVSGSVNLTGPNFSATVSSGNGSYGLRQCTLNVNPFGCTSASVAWQSTGGDLFGTFTVNGQTFNSDIINQLGLFFSGPTFVIPAELLGASALHITAPFTFSGGASSPSLSEIVMLQGEGTVHVFLVHRTFGIFSGLFLDHADYIFGSTVTGVTVEEVPEPATLMLLLSGLAGGAVYRRRRTARRDLELGG